MSAIHPHLADLPPDVREMAVQVAALDPDNPVLEDAIVKLVRLTWTRAYRQAVEDERNEARGTGDQP